MAKRNRTTLGMAQPDAAWQAECDLETLMRAKEIQSDPKRSAAVKKLAAEKLQQVASVAGDTPAK